MKLFKFIILCFLAGCASTKQPESIVNLDYRNEPPIKLDVAEITVVNKFTPTASNRLLPPDLIAEVTEWATTRFVPGGSKGTAVINILNVEVLESHLVAKKEVNALLNTDLEPMKYGSNITVSIDVLDSTSYAKGQVQTDIKRHVTVDTDILLGFDKPLWNDFRGKIINSLDRQVLLDLDHHMPLLKMVSAGIAAA